MIEIASYQHVNGACFGCKDADVIAVFGNPDAKSVNQEGELELGYGKFIVRLESGSNLFREFTLLPKCDAEVNGVKVEWLPSFLAVVQKIDPDLVEVLGFVLSLKMGLAFSGFHDEDFSQMAIHAFREGDWDMFRKRMRPFRYGV